MLWSFSRMNKQFSILILVAILCASLPTGCTTTGGQAAHPEAIAKKTLEGIADSVDVAMKVWARYAVLNKLTVEQQRPVKEAHDKYRIFATSARDFVRELRLHPAPGGYEKATAIANAAADELIKLIYTFTE